MEWKEELIGNSVLLLQNLMDPPQEGDSMEQVRAESAKGFFLQTREGIRIVEQNSKVRLVGLKGEAESKDPDVGENPTVKQKYWKVRQTVTESQSLRCWRWKKGF